MVLSRDAGICYSRFFLAGIRISSSCSYGPKAAPKNHRTCSTRVCTLGRFRYCKPPLVFLRGAHSGIYGPFGIPVEEYGFFIIIPVAGILTLEGVTNFSPRLKVGLPASERSENDHLFVAGRNRSDLGVCLWHSCNEIRPYFKTAILDFVGHHKFLSATNQRLFDQPRNRNLQLRSNYRNSNRLRTNRRPLFWICTRHTNDADLGMGRADREIS